jgi:hypothetical protein
MKRYNSLVAVTVLLLALSKSPSQTAPAKLAPKPKVDPCQAQEEKSFSEGWKQASESVSKDSWGKGFRAGVALEELIYSVKIGESPKLQSISIVVEDIDGATSYQFAAAEVIRTYFADTMVAAPSATLSLHISGTKSLSVGYGADVQSVEVEVIVPASQTLTVAGENRLISGNLQLAFGGGTMKGYSPQEKTQAVREYVYKVLSAYKEKWEKAAPKDT